MAMVYDLPTVEASAVPMQKFEAQDTRNYAAEQGQKMGQAITNAGNALDAIVNDYQHNIDTAKTKESDNVLSDRIRGIMLDPDNGYIGTTGKAAVDARSSALKGIDDAIKEIEPTLENDVQRYMFKRAALQRKQSAMQQIDAHALQQGKVYNMGESEARMERFRLDAEANIGNDEAYTVAKQNMVREASDYAKLAGLGGEQEQKLVLAATTKLHANVVDQLIADDNVKLAKDYYEKYKEEINPDAYDNIGKKIKDGIAYVDGKTLGKDTFIKFAGKLGINEEPPVAAMEEYIEKKGGSEKEKAYALADLKDRVTRFEGARRKVEHEYSNKLHGMMTNDNDRAEYNQVLKAVNQWEDGGIINSTVADQYRKAADVYYHISEDRAIAKSAAAQAAHLQKMVDNAVNAQVILQDYASGKYGKMDKNSVLQQFTPQVGNQIFSLAGTIEKMNDKLENPSVTLKDFNNRLKLMYATPEGKKLLGFDPAEKGNASKVLQLFDSTLSVMSAEGKKGPGNQIGLDAALQKSLQDVAVPGKWWGTNQQKAFEIPALSEGQKRKLAIDRLNAAGWKINPDKPTPQQEQVIKSALDLINKPYSKTNRLMSADAGDDTE